MDALVTTHFPDIRLKAAVQSADKGSILIIPREGGYLVRLYIELDVLKPTERAADRNVTSDLIVAKAKEILAPYSFKVHEIAWWSAYEVGQRVCETFDDAAVHQDGPRVFIAGDACHTHSPKAGQGMNVSMADSFNLGWKLAAVLREQAHPDLLRSYSEERRAKAKELIDFDRDMAELFSRKPENPEEAALFQNYFKQHARYTAGVETRYDSGGLTGAGDHQGLARGLKIGMRFHSAPVIRMADARPMQLGHVIKADGRWRLLAFAPQSGQGLDRLCDFLAKDPGSPILKFTPPEADIDSVIDVRAIFQIPHHEMNFADLPIALRPTKGRYGLVDYEKIFCADGKAGRDIFDLRNIDRVRGALVIIRPDQFIADIMPLSDTGRLMRYFDEILQVPTN